MTALRLLGSVSRDTRSTRKLSLTVEDESYYVRCRQVLAELEDAEERARRGGGQPQGTLRVGLHPALRLAVMSEIDRLLGPNPRLRIETFITNSPSALLDPSSNSRRHSEWLTSPSRPPRC